ncbi:ASPP1 protein, partial [Amia calva]|nr:ASPP1 protein [Amia calva]
MILTVYLSNSEQVAAEVPITPETTCRDVVEFCKEPGETGCHLAEVWRGNERAIPFDHMMYEHLQKWGPRRPEVKFFLRHEESPTDNSEQGVQQAQEQSNRRNGVSPPGEKHCENGVGNPRVELTLSELQDMASRQQQQIEAQQQMLVAKEQRLRFLKQQERRQQQSVSETEKLQRLKDRVDSQEAKLKKIRAMRGQVDYSKVINGNLSAEIEHINSMFQEKQEELQSAVLKVEQLTQQLEDLRRGKLNGLQALSGQVTGAAALELRKLYQELQIRNKLNQEQNSKLQQHKDQLNKRNMEVTLMDRRIGELRQRLYKKKAEARHKENIPVVSDLDIVVDPVLPSPPAAQQPSDIRLGHLAPPLPDALSWAPPGPGLGAAGLKEDQRQQERQRESRSAVGSVLRAPVLGSSPVGFSALLRVTAGGLGLLPESHFQSRSEERCVNIKKWVVAFLYWTPFHTCAHIFLCSPSTLQQRPQVRSRDGNCKLKQRDQCFRFARQGRDVSVEQQRTTTVTVLGIDLKPPVPPIPLSLSKQVSATLKPPSVDWKESSMDTAPKPGSPASGPDKGPPTVNSSSIYYMYLQQAVPPKTYQPNSKSAVKAVYGKPVLPPSSAPPSPLPFLPGAPLPLGVEEGMERDGPREGEQEGPCVPGEGPPPSVENIPRPLSPTKLTPMVHSPLRYQSDADLEALRKKLANAPRPLKKRSSITEPEGPSGPNIQKLLYQRFNTLAGGMENGGGGGGGSGLPFYQPGPPPDYMGGVLADMDNANLPEPPSQAPPPPATEPAEPLQLSPLPPPSDANDNQLPPPPPEEPTPGLSVLPATATEDSNNNPAAPPPGDSLPSPIPEASSPEEAGTPPPPAAPGPLATATAKRTNLKKPNSERTGHGLRVKFNPLALLLDASLEGEFDLVQRIIYEVENPSTPNDEGITPLHNAVCAGHHHIVRFLLDFGVNVNAADSDGWTPLHCAASCNSVHLCKLLVESGAAIFATTISDVETAADKCEEMEEGYIQCSQFLYGEASASLSPPLSIHLNSIQGSFTGMTRLQCCQSN